MILRYYDNAGNTGSEETGNLSVIGQSVELHHMDGVAYAYIPQAPHIRTVHFARSLGLFPFSSQSHFDITYIILFLPFDLLRPRCYPSASLELQVDRSLTLRHGASQGKDGKGFGRRRFVPSS